MGEIQDEIFRPEDFPEDPEAVEAVKRYCHTAARVLEDPRIQSIIDDLMFGQGVKTVARRYAMSPHTVRAIKRELEGGGRLAPFKDRARVRMQDLHESSAEELQDRFDRCPEKIGDNILPFVLGVTHDKLADMSDRAAGMGEVRQGGAAKGGNSAADSLAARIREAKQAIVEDVSQEGRT